ncbi:unnamed protein product [Orchesella dallaii]|uniref:Deacetylase sirtuin-type domain-containing protein n=1 Tax=Orchesella dallaii TaxID=48710 RepID=A0ABP1QXI2_9HEXA
MEEQQQSLLTVQNRGDGGEFNNQEIVEPQRKKRCIRFASDLSAEDPLLIGDSGFGDLPKFEEEHGDLEVSSYFTSDDISDVPEPEEEEEEVEAEEDGVTTSGFESFSEGNTQSNFSSSVGDRDPCCSSASSSRSSSSSSNHDSSFSSQDGDGDCDFSFLFNHKEIAANPMRTAMLQRFLSQYRSNPNDSHLQHLLSIILSGPEFSPRRNRLRHVSTIQDAARLLRCSKRVMVLTGAGISVSCGIPDFRSKDGLYSRVAKVFPELRDPQSVFDIRLFRRDPRPFFLTAKELYPGQFEPSPSHRFIRKLEQRGQLLRNYSQNIDTLETIAGIERVTMCHGSFATATCIRCKHKVSAEDIKEKVLAGEVPFCTVCSNEEEWSKIQFPLGQSSSQQPQEGPRRSSLDDDEDDDSYFFPDPDPLPPVVKPDIVFFGEDLPEEFHTNLTADKPHCDLLVVIGSSLRVRPVSLIPGMVPAEVPQILINREPLPQVNFDIELFGNSDSIIAELCGMMGPDFAELSSDEPLNEVSKLVKDGIEEKSNADVMEPKSEHDVEALKACWEPKTTHNLAEKLPRKFNHHWL